ncbi:MAG: hypothetical protein R3C18_10000 [Planctomycetaceae bacterium]
MDGDVAEHYEAHMRALSAKDRMARSVAMLQWSREVISRQLLAELGAMSPARLKLEVAKRIYRADAAICQLIDQELMNVSG